MGIYVVWNCCCDVTARTGAEYVFLVDECVWECFVGGEVGRAEEVGKGSGAGGSCAGRGKGR